MTPERWEKVGEIFNSAVEKSPADRERYLAEACGDDFELRSEVESLLAAGNDAGRFISEPVLRYTSETPQSLRQPRIAVSE